MKKLFLIIILAITAFSSGFAQIKEGKITYERKVNMWRSITDPEMRSRIPEFRTDRLEMLFNEQSSLFRPAPEDEAPDPFASSGGDRGGDRGGMARMFRALDATTYTNIAAQLQYESRAFLEREFLIIDSTKFYKWKISEETKTIAKHVCKKATTMIVPNQMTMRFGVGGGGRNQRDSSATPAKPKEIELTVWYTEDIPVSVGPDNYAGLPGAILEIDSDNGNTVTMAVEISAKYPKKELVQPTKGEKMNRVQFQDNVKKIMEDMQKSGGFGGFRNRGGQ